jgi:hypothetical protein
MPLTTFYWKLKSNTSEEFVNKPTTNLYLKDCSLTDFTLSGESVDPVIHREVSKN